MGRIRENPRYEVVSFRLSDEELEMSRRLAAVKGKCLGEVIRDHWLAEVYRIAGGARA